MSVIFSNILGYDGLIFLAAVATGVIYWRLRTAVDRLHKKMNLTVYVPDKGESRREADRDIHGMRESDVVALRNDMGKWYSIFVNMTGIFPLMGILGTVISLLGMVEDMSNVQGNFYGALTSTLWGLVFAIGYKFMDGLITPRIEENEKSVALYLERNSGGLR